MAIPRLYNKGLECTDGLTSYKKIKENFFIQFVKELFCTFTRILNIIQGTMNLFLQIFELIPSGLIFLQKEKMLYLTKKKAK